MRSSVVTSALVLGLLTSAAWAAAPSSPPPASVPSVASTSSPSSPGAAPRPFGQYLQQADTDGDGAISRAEFLASSAKRAEERFAAMDKNGDGKFTPDERTERPMRPHPPGPKGMNPDCFASMPEGGHGMMMPPPPPPSHPYPQPAAPMGGVIAPVPGGLSAPSPAPAPPVAR